MSKHQQLINKGLELADKGLFTKKNIDSVIKTDFMNQYNSAKNLMSLYKKLSKKYDKGICTIMKICNH